MRALAGVTTGGVAASLVLSLLMLGFPAACAGEAEAVERRTISVVGRGELTVAPDLAVLSVAVETTARSAGEATSSNAERCSRVVEAIRAFVDRPGALKTSRYTLEPQYASRKPGSNDPPTIVGYIARNEVRAEIRKLDAVGEIVDAALAAGANRVSHLSFLVEDRNPHLRAALALAGAEAKAQAESIASALGVKLGQVLSVSTSGAPTPIRYEKTFAVMRAEAAATPIEAGEVDVSATLQVTYEIQ